jgi:NADH-quinone oxidoreductase subunit A
VPACGDITSHALLTSYGPALVFLAIGLIVAAAFGMAPMLLGPRRAASSRQSQLTPYECGLPSEVTRNFRFGISFYLIAMLFILFDIEVIFLYPIAVQLRAFGSFALVETAVFVALLMVAFVYVWRRGALEWK